MSVDQISALLALLSLMAVTIGVVSIVSAISGPGEQVRPLVDLLLPLAFTIALVATLGSLYYSGIVNFRPCRLCWWQRIMMYPLVPVLGVAAARKDRFGAVYAAPLALGGLGYAAYHTQLRWFPEQGSSCEAEAACTTVWVNTFGFISIPFMAGAGFLAVLGLLALHWRLTSPRESSLSTTQPETTEVPT